MSKWEKYSAVFYAKGIERKRKEAKGSERKRKEAKGSERKRKEAKGSERKRKEAKAIKVGTEQQFRVNVEQNQLNKKKTVCFIHGRTHTSCARYTVVWAEINLPVVL